jgi:hypothetical protein
MADLWVSAGETALWRKLNKTGLFKENTKEGCPWKHIVLSEQKVHQTAL